MSNYALCVGYMWYLKYVCVFGWEQHIRRNNTQNWERN